MAIKPKSINAIHVKDIGWLIALYFAIHGGRPGQEISAEEVNKTAKAMIRALAAHLDPVTAKAVGAAVGR
jgi:hypothetical protein